MGSSLTNLIVGLSPIVDAQVDAGAAIARSKLANGTVNTLSYSNASGVLSDAANYTIDGSGELSALLQKRIKFYDLDSTNFVALKAAAVVAADLTLVLPTADGTENQAMVTDGAGNMSFMDVVQLGLGLTNAMAQGMYNL